MRARFPSVLVLLTVLWGPLGLAAPGSAQDPPVAGDSPAPAQTSETRLADEAEELIATVRAAQAELDQLRPQAAAAEGEERLVLERLLGRKRVDSLALVHRLCQNILRQERAGLDTTTLRAIVMPVLEQIDAGIRAILEDIERSIAEANAARGSLSPAELEKLERQLSADHAQIDAMYRALLDNAELMESMGLDATGEREYLVGALARRAEMVGARIELSREQTVALGERAGKQPDNADLQAELRAARERLDGAVSSLGATVKMMDALGLRTTEYKRLLLQATGELGTNILDTGVALSLLQLWLRSARQWIVNAGPNMILKVFVLLLILALFKLLATVTRRVLRRVFTVSKVGLSQLAQDMLLSVSSKAIMALGVLVSLSQLGVSLGPVLAGLGVAGFILGFALQESLSNFAAGAMILVYRPFDVGDLIEAGGVFGRVNHMSLVSTTIMTFDNQTLIVPNRKIWGDVIKNVTAQATRRVDMEFGISYADDIPHAERVLREIVDEHGKVLSDPEPMVRLHKLGQSSLEFVVRPWVRTDDYWEVYWDVTREVKMRFDREGISIPFPQRDVHIHPSSPGQAASGPSAGKPA